MAESAVAVVERPIDLALLKAVGLDKLAPEQRQLALHIAERYELDLMLKHLVMIEGRPYITRDGLLHVAHRSGLFDGIEASPAEIIEGFWRSTCSVWRKDMARPFTYTGRYPTTGGNQKYAPEMAIKVGEVMALRRAFDVTAPVYEERWETAEDVAEPPVKLSLAERAAAKAEAVAEPVTAEPEPPGATEPSVPAEVEPLTTEQIRDLLKEAGITPAEAAVKAAELFPNWNQRKELTNLQRGILWDALR